MSTEEYQHLFDTEHLKLDLKNKSIRGGLSTMAGESISFILRIVSLVVLARLLMPEQFGLIAMITALTNFALMFKDLGLSTATIQRKDINREQVSTLFWINVGFGTLIMFIVVALSPVIAWFYGEQRLVMISVALSTSFFFSGLTVQHQALLNRQMRFGRLACVKILSITLSIIVGISLALQGFEYWALVWKNVSITAFAAVGIWLMCRWWPGLPKRRPGVSAMLRFGRDITGYNIINYFSRNLDKILIGRFWGAGPLGLYDKAYHLMLMPISQLRFPINSVAISALSTLQEEPDRYRRYYKKLISILSFISMPLVMYLGIFSEDVIRLVLGENWIKAAPIFKILAITAFIQPVSSTCGMVMITCNKTKRYFMWGVMTAVCMISAFCIGVIWGPIGIATAYTVVNYSILIPSLWYSFRETPISISLFFQAISLPAFSSLLMGLLLTLISQKMTSLSIPVKIAFSLISAIIAYCGVYWLIPGGKQKIIEYCSYPLAVLKR
ncbi:MAG: lipopolysaccharide biosynthesis protein [Candidatus Hodarchaeota archaeon]